MKDLGTLGELTGAQVINNHGLVIGQSRIAADPGACNGFSDNSNLNCHAFLWGPGKLVDLTTSTISSSPPFLAAINDSDDLPATWPASLIAQMLSAVRVMMC